jgi:hypothetical protein
MGGRIVQISIDYLIETPEGPQRETVDLASMVQHCRRERVEDLLDDATMLCEDALATRGSGRPVLALVRRPT